MQTTAHSRLQYRHNIPIRSGYLAQTLKFGKPKPLFFSLDGAVLYTHSDEYSPATSLIGLTEATIAYEPGSKDWTIKVAGSSMALSAATASNAQEWVSALQQAVNFKWENFYGTLNVLGKGSYATVYGGYDKQTNEQVAVKVLRKKDMKPDEILLLKREYDVLKTIRHPNIVRCLDIFNSENTLTTIFELMGGGTVEKWLLKSEHKRIPEDLCREVARDILRAIRYLHSVGIVHRDIKPANMMTKTRTAGKVEAKLIDFGFAKPYAEDMMKTVIGTPIFSAPELLTNHEGYGLQIDIFALGVSLCLMLTGSCPFDGQNSMEVIYAIKSAAPNFPPALWSTISPQAMSLVKGMLNKDPNVRLTATSALQHPWFDNLRELPDGATRTMSLRNRFRMAAFAVMFYSRPVKTDRSPTSSTADFFSGQDVCRMKTISTIQASSPLRQSKLLLSPRRKTESVLGKEGRRISVVSATKSPQGQSCAQDESESPTEQLISPRGQGLRKMLTVTSSGESGLLSPRRPRMFSFNNDDLPSLHKNKEKEGKDNGSMFSGLRKLLVSRE